MESYKDLEIYKLAYKVVVEIHEMSLKKLPCFEMYEEGSQIRKSSKAVVSNIVEGFGRKRYPQDYIRFLVYAHSSCDETQQHLKLLFETRFLKSKEKYDYFFEQCDKLSRKINKFIQAVDQA